MKNAWSIEQIELVTKNTSWAQGIWSRILINSSLFEQHGLSYWSSVYQCQWFDCWSLSSLLRWVSKLIIFSVLRWNLFKLKISVIRIGHTFCVADLSKSLNLRQVYGKSQSTVLVFYQKTLVMPIYQLENPSHRHFRWIHHFRQYSCLWYYLNENLSLAHDWVKLIPHHRFLYRLLFLLHPRSKSCVVDCQLTWHFSYLWQSSPMFRFFLDWFSVFGLFLVQFIVFIIN